MNSRVLVSMESDPIDFLQHLEFDQNKLALSPGMQVAAEIKLTDQTVMEYLLSPVRKAFHEAGRER